MSYIYVLLHWWPYITSIPHQHTSACFLYIDPPTFNVSIPNWHSESLERIIIISRFSPCPSFLFTSFLCSFSLTVSATSENQTWNALDKNPHNLFFIPPHNIHLHPPSNKWTPGITDVHTNDASFWRLLLSFLSESPLNRSKSDLEYNQSLSSKHYPLRLISHKTVTTP